jgi:hypothetical protein
MNFLDLVNLFNWFTLYPKVFTIILFYLVINFIWFFDLLKKLYNIFQIINQAYFFISCLLISYKIIVASIFLVTFAFKMIVYCYKTDLSSSKNFFSHFAIFKRKGFSNQLMRIEENSVKIKKPRKYYKLISKYYNRHEAFSRMNSEIDGMIYCFR